MERAASKYGYMDRIRTPRSAQPHPIIHRKRHKPEWVDGTQLRGTEYWKAIGLTVLVTIIMFLVWWYGCK